jgi:hypothetical protein
MPCSGDFFNYFPDYMPQLHISSFSPAPESLIDLQSRPSELRYLVTSRMIASQPEEAVNDQSYSLSDELAC